MSRVDHAAALIKASPSQVYRALVDPELLVRWLPPQGATARIDRLDAAPGNAIAMTLTFAPSTSAQGKTTADTDSLKGSFVDLQPDRRVSQRFTFESDDPAFAGEMLMSWMLQQSTGGTIVTVTAEDVPSGIAKEVHEDAMTSSLGKLAALLEHVG